MKLTDFFAAQLEREALITRPALARVPDGRADWKPHEKSMPFGYLAVLVASMPAWVSYTIDLDELDLNPPGGSSRVPTPAGTNEDLLKTFDDSVGQGRLALSKTTDEHLMTGWKLLVAGKVVMENPRHIVLADTFTHLAHHRGQLTVYLRLNGAAVPSIYGPTADDRTF